MTLKNLELRTDKNWQAVISKVAHFFANKLAILQSKNSDLQEIFPILFKSYELALKHKLIDAEIPKKLVEYYQEEGEVNLEKQIKSMFQVLEALQRLSHNIGKQTTIQSTSAVDCVNKMLQSYPFKENERQWVQFNPAGDFDIPFSTFFIEATLTCLFDFALAHFNKSNSYQYVAINLENDNHEMASIHIKISSPAIKTSAYDYLLKNYLVITTDQTSPNISFCQLALTYVGSHIAYEIIENQSLELVISIAKSPQAS